MNKVKQYLQEKEMEFYDQPQVDQKLPDNSDKPHNADDFMYSNSDMQSFYARGNGFVVNDHQPFYEVIKAIKDLTDRHFFLRDMTWKVNFLSNKATVDFSVGQEESPEADEFFFNGIQQYLMLSLFKKFGNEYKFDTKFFKNIEDRNVMRVTIEVPQDQGKPLLFYGNEPNPETIIPKDSSITKM